MAVYTEICADDIRLLIAELNLGKLRDLKGITSGIENTNYFLTCDSGEFVLTLFERLSFKQLPFYLHLMRHLAERNIPVPMPRANATGEILHSIKGKPTAIANKLPGAWQLAPQVEHCRQVGATLAMMHRAGSDFVMHQPNLRGLNWMVQTTEEVNLHLMPAQQELLERELEFQRQLEFMPESLSLPSGPVHADLFRDNVLFEGESLSGIIDFYFAGVDTFVFDIAVCLNDWCTDLVTGALDWPRVKSFCTAYDKIRPLHERSMLPMFLRRAALRFWLSRLRDWHLPRKASLLKPHDPEHFERILRQRTALPPRFEFD